MVIKKSLDPDVISKLSASLLNEIEYNRVSANYAKVDQVLKMVGLGLFLSSFALIPGLARGIKPFINFDSKDPYKRLNLYHLKKSLKRLQDKKLVQAVEVNGELEIKITDSGKTKLLKYALDEVELKKPKLWDKKWHLISYDIKNKHTKERKILLHYLKLWSFYKIHDSLYIHPYPCFDEVEYLRQYLNIGDMVRFFIVDDFESSKPYREYFGV